MTFVQPNGTRQCRVRPHAGQIIKGEGDKGLKMMLIFYFALPSAVYVSLLLNAYLFLLALGTALFSGIILWGYNIWDAFTHETSG